MLASRWLEVNSNKLNKKLQTLVAAKQVTTTICHPLYSQLDPKVKHSVYHGGQSPNLTTL